MYKKHPTTRRRDNIYKLNKISHDLQREFIPLKRTVTIRKTFKQRFVTAKKLASHMQRSFLLVQQKKCFSSGTAIIPFRTAIKRYSILLSCLERKLKEKWQTIGALLKKCLQTTNMQSLSTWFKWSRSVLAKENMFFSVQSKFALVKITLHIRYPFHKTSEKGGQMRLLQN